MVAIRCDRCGCLSGKDRVWTSVVGLAMGFAMAILIVGKENLPRNPIVSAQQV